MQKRKEERKEEKRKIKKDLEKVLTKGCGIGILTKLSRTNGKAKQPERPEGVGEDGP